MAVYSYDRRIVRASLRELDKRVVKAFVGRSPADGQALMTDGKSLELVGLGGGRLAVWRGDKIAIVALESSKTEQEVLRYLVKVGGKSLVTWSYDRAGFQKSLTYESGGDSFSRGQYDAWLLAFVPGREKPVGRLEYSIFEGRAGINIVEVDPEFKRTGIARELMREMMQQNHLTKKDIDPGMMTDEGYAFWTRSGI